MTVGGITELYTTLDRRVRPEEVARLIQKELPLSDSERRKIQVASRRDGRWSSMTDDFARPGTMASQIAVARALFAAPAPVDPADMEALETYLKQAESEIGKAFGANDFLADRLTREERANAGIELSKRQYNKRFRLAARMEAKRQRVLREELKRALTLASKSRLASRLKQEHLQDANTAAFVAYYVSRCNLRSMFTNGSQVRPYDEICEVLMQRCRASETTNWLTIAYVLPDADVLAHIDAESRGILLGAYFTMMKQAADLLGEVWERSNINRETMVVRRGNDSSTWNITAGAWNKLRSGWFSLLFSLGLQEWIKAMCPGKVLRLMAADVAYWHSISGGDLHADTGPWCDLPLPWEVLNGEASCPRSLVEAVCQKWGVDGIKAGWLAPPPERKVAAFTPTPELVYGVEVTSPQLALVLRKAGVFSGKQFRPEVLESGMAGIAQW